MANEAVLIFETELPIPFTCADGTGIEKGAILKMTDPMTASASTGAVDVFAGICAEEKVANNGCQKVPVYRGGIFRVTLSGSCLAGDILCTSETANMVKKSQSTISGSKAVGFALETGATGETIMFELRPGVCLV
jgi:hypothetical protein